jgi:thiamine-monophosphate kinase
MNSSVRRDDMAVGDSSQDSGEDRLIAHYFGPLAKHPGAFGLGDDAAAITPPPGCDVVLTADGLVGGIHFFPDDPPGAIASKALRVNLSDLAAKAAEPIGFLLTLALPANTTEEWLAAFSEELGADAEHYQCPLLGGDTVSTTGPLTISIAALGAVPHGRMVKRSGAAPGNLVFVTGSIGDAALGLLLRRDRDAANRWALPAATADHLQQRYLLPQPRLALRRALLDHASAAMDVSDGLAGDLAKLCRVSAVSAEIDLEQVPLSAAARAVVDADPDAIQTIMGGGDDYEILAIVSDKNAEAFRAQAHGLGVPVTAIGRIIAGSEPVRFQFNGKPFKLARMSYSHF